MTRSKLQKFADLDTFVNTFQITSGLKGRWHQHYFQNDHPITLELGCGKGEYSLYLAKRFPKRNFVGVDIKGSRIWNGAKKALQENLTNIAFLRTRIENLAEEFGMSEVETIWIPFPDPYPKRSKAKKRLTSPRFLKLYEQILTPSGKIHMKTDDPNLYRFTLATLKRENHTIVEYHPDLYKVNNPTVECTIRTLFEKKQTRAGHTIKYICFQINR